GNRNDGYPLHLQGGEDRRDIAHAIFRGKGGDVQILVPFVEATREIFLFAELLLAVQNGPSRSRPPLVDDQNFAITGKRKQVGETLVEVGRERVARSAREQKHRGAARRLPWDQSEDAKLDRALCCRGQRHFHL